MTKILEHLPPQPRRRRVVHRRLALTQPRRVPHQPPAADDASPPTPAPPPPPPTPHSSRPRLHTIRHCPPATQVEVPRTKVAPRRRRHRRPQRGKKRIVLRLQNTGHARHLRGRRGEDNASSSSHITPHTPRRGARTAQSMTLSVSSPAPQPRSAPSPTRTSSQNSACPCHPPQKPLSTAPTPHLKHWRRIPPRISKPPAPPEKPRVRAA